MSGPQIAKKKPKIINQKFMTNQENLISGEWETTQQFGRLPLKLGGLECLHQSLPK